eukprot:jgi/Orpsp1_1/1191913/evm.model.d7180000089346.1
MMSKVNLLHIILQLCTLFGNYVVGKRAKVYTDCLKPGQFALTFDDGPNLETTPRALDVLEKYNIKGTFFINGFNWSDLDNNPEAVKLVKKIYRKGHDIGSHTFYHRDLFDALQEGSMKKNIDKMTDKIEDILGVKPAYFRPPSGHGGHNVTDPYKQRMVEKIQDYLGDRDYNIIMWSADSNDWNYGEDVEKVIDSLNEQLISPDISPRTHSFITLLHDVHASTVDIILPTIIKYIRNLGYTIVPLSECIGVSPYQNGDKNRNIGNNENDVYHSNYNSSATSISNNESNTIFNDVNNNKSNSTSVNNIEKEINSKDDDSTSDAIILNYSIFINIVAIILLSLF